MSLLSMSGQNQKWVPTIALVALIVALGVLVKQCTPMTRMRKSAQNLHSMAGEIAAEETAKLIGKGKAALATLDFGSGEMLVARLEEPALSRFLRHRVCGQVVAPTRVESWRTRCALQRKVRHRLKVFLGSG